MSRPPTIPGYELLGPLGGGPMTVVYAARDLADDAPCAVKTVRPEWEDQATAAKLLQREARAALAVRHPGLVAPLSAHVTRPPCFLVLPLLSGESLRRRLRRDYRLGVAEAVWAARQAAQAVAALHTAGFLHGDVKPDNLFLTDGTVRLLDLGFAHRPGENAAFLRAGYVLGTASYLPPEMCRDGEAEEPRSDVFSLGVTLFELLTGRLPYPAGSVGQTVRRHLDLEPDDVRDHVAEAPAALALLVAGMLSARPEERPRAAAVAQQLIRLEIAALGGRLAG
jgi:serine/threonine-protein kinase